MTRFIKLQGAKVLLGVTVATLGFSVAWAWRQGTALRRIRTQAVKVQITGADYQPAAWGRVASAPSPWLKPAASAPGGKWLYELFTPPAIYYNATTGTFTAKPGDTSAGREDPFDLVLAGVKPELFRLQLTGYFGGPGDYVAAFAEPGRPDVVLARIGRRFANLGLTFKSFAVGRVAPASGDGGIASEMAAVAVLRDEITGADVQLDSRAPLPTGRSLAVFEGKAADGRAVELPEGEMISVGDSVYRVDRIRLDPPEVTLVRQHTGLPSPEQKILRSLSAPPPPAKGQLTTSNPSSARPVAGLHTNPHDNATPQ